MEFGVLTFDLSLYIMLIKVIARFVLTKLGTASAHKRWSYANSFNHILAGQVELRLTDVGIT